MADNKSAPDPSMDEILASIRRILAEDDSVVTHSPNSADEAANDVLDLTEALNDDGSVRHIAPIKMVPPEAPMPPPPLPDGRIEPVAPRPEDALATQRLVSDGASEAVAASFARLSGLPRREGAEQPLDELVRETLRPLLQAWLDEHLPDLVERLVRAEIVRMVGDRPAAP
jgi:cell pole-organizing protein PopZ